LFKSFSKSISSRTSAKDWVSTFARASRSKPRPVWSSGSNHLHFRQPHSLFHRPWTNRR
jgi:hypothetical protein